MYRGHTHTHTSAFSAVTCYQTMIRPENINTDNGAVRSGRVKSRQSSVHTDGSTTDSTGDSKMSGHRRPPPAPPPCTALGRHTETTRSHTPTRRHRWYAVRSEQSRYGDGARASESYSIHRQPQHEARHGRQAGREHDPHKIDINRNHAVNGQPPLRASFWKPIRCGTWQSTS